MIGWDVQDQLFPHIDPIGRIMKVDGYPVKVIGTLAKQGNVMGQSQDSVVYMPLTLFKKRIAPNEDIGVFMKPIGGVAHGRSGDGRGPLDPPFAAEDQVRQGRSVRSRDGGDAPGPLEEHLGRAPSCS